MDPAAQTYVDGIADDTRPLFDRIHQLIVGEYTAIGIGIGISYKMPVYRRANRSLIVGAWKHGVSIYGFPDEGALSILEAHPELFSGKETYGRLSRSRLCAGSSAAEGGTAGAVWRR